MAAKRGVQGFEKCLREQSIRAIIFDQDVWVKCWRIHPMGLLDWDISFIDGAFES